MTLQYLCTRSRDKSNTFFYFISHNIQHPLLKTSNLLDGKRPHYRNVSHKKRESKEEEENDDGNDSDNSDEGESYEEKRANENQSGKRRAK